MNWTTPFLLTFQLMGLSVAIAMLIGVSLAWAVSVLDSRSTAGRLIRGYFFLCVVTSIATPMILHAAAWEATAGKFGWLTFSQTAARTYTGWGGQYGGMIACAWVHGITGAAFVALGTWFGTSRIPQGVIDASRLELKPTQVWFLVQLPIARPWILLAGLLVALLAATEMTVVDLYGVRTLADEFYLFHASQPSMTSILATLVLPIALAIASLAVVSLNADRRPSLRTAADATDVRSTSGTATQLLASSIALAFSTLFIVVPFAGLLIKTGHQVVVTPETGSASVHWSLYQCVSTLSRAPVEFAREYQWTIALAVGIAAVAVPLALLLAAATRERPLARRLLEAALLILFLIPGPIIGLMIVRFFSLPIPGFRQLYTGTLLPTLVALLARSLPMAYLIVRTGYRGIDSSLFDAARLELSWIRRIWVLDRPLLTRPLLLAAAATAIFGTGDVPASLPVLPPGVVTVGTRLFSLLHSGARYQEASLAFWYVAGIACASCLCLSRWNVDRR